MTERLFGTDGIRGIASADLTSELALDLGRAFGAWLAQQTDYPEAETILLSLDMDQSARFSLKFRIPAWAQGVSATVNGEEADLG